MTNMTTMDRFIPTNTGTDLRIHNNIDDGMNDNCNFSSSSYPSARRRRSCKIKFHLSHPTYHHHRYHEFYNIHNNNTTNMRERKNTGTIYTARGTTTRTTTILVLLSYYVASASFISSSSHCNFNQRKNWNHAIGSGQQTTATNYIYHTTTITPTIPSDASLSISTTCTPNAHHSATKKSPFVNNNIIHPFATTTCTQQHHNDEQHYHYYDYDDNYKYTSSSLSSLPSFSSSSSPQQYNYHHHYNDALLNRILSGRNSIHSKWRKKTKRAAIVLGIPSTITTIQTRSTSLARNYKDDNEEEEDYVLPNYNLPSFSSSAVATNYNHHLTNIDYIKDHDYDVNKYSSNLWNVSRGGGGSSCSENDINNDYYLKPTSIMDMNQNNNNSYYVSKPVPPSTSTFLRSFQNHLQQQRKESKKNQINKKINCYNDKDIDNSKNNYQKHKNIINTNEITNDDKMYHENTDQYNNNNKSLSSLFSRKAYQKKNDKRQQQSSSIRGQQLNQPQPQIRSLTKEEQTQAKLQWIAKYTSLSTLRQTFGSNRNRFWGDFDSQTTRKLYHTLLPRALLELYDIGLWSPKELAPLAYEARKAAKKYARERCVVPGRIMAMFYDGYRSWRDWGTWSVEGMSWEQVWDKYENQILQEMMDECEEDEGSIYRYCATSDDDDESVEECCIIDLNESSVQEEITAQICLRILERSCGTNALVDRIFLRKDDEEDICNNFIEESRVGSREMPTMKKRLFSKLNRDNNGGDRSTSVKRKRRRRNAERDLARIRNQLENDMQDLLQLSHRYDGKSN